MYIYLMSSTTHPFKSPSIFMYLFDFTFFLLLHSLKIWLLVQVYGIHGWILLSASQKDMNQILLVQDTAGA